MEIQSDVNELNAIVSKIRELTRSSKLTNITIDLSGNEFPKDVDIIYSKFRGKETHRKIPIEFLYNDFITNIIF